MAYSRTGPQGSRLFTMVSEHHLIFAIGLVLLAVALGALLYSSRNLSSSNVPRTKITHRQLTSLGYAYEPAISPDGLSVAYVSRKFGEPQKLMVRASTGEELELSGVRTWHFRDGLPTGPKYFSLAMSTHRTIQSPQRKFAAFQLFLAWAELFIRYLQGYMPVGLLPMDRRLLRLVSRNRKVRVSGW